MGFVTDTDTNGGKADLMRKLLAISLASVGAVLLATAVLVADGGGGHDSAARHNDPISSELAITSIPPTSSTTAAPAAVVPAEPEPEPVLSDGRNPVFLTDIDVDGRTVEFDLLQYLTGAEEEAYDAAHPTDYAGCDCDGNEGPIHNDNPRLRRLPVAADMGVVVQGSTQGSCDGPTTTTFAALPGYFVNGDHDYEPDTGHLGYNAFWLTVDHDTVVDIEELSCAA